MALKNNWVDKVDGEDIVQAADINEIANAVIELEGALGRDTIIWQINQDYSAVALGDVVTTTDSSLTTISGKTPNVNDYVIDNAGNILRIHYVTANGGLVLKMASLASSSEDYVLTAADKEEIVSTLKTEVPLVKTAEQPTFVNSVDEMTDTSKVYVMPDGFLYAYMEGKASRTFTAGDFKETQLNGNGEVIGTSSTIPNRIVTSELIDLSKGKVSIYCPSAYQYIIYYYTSNSTSAFLTKTSFKTGNIDDVLNDTPASGQKPTDGATHCRVSLRYSANTSADLTGKTNEFVANVIVSQDSNTSAYYFQSTGLSYNQPADYEERIVALENALGDIENGSY